MRPRGVVAAGEQAVDDGDQLGRRIAAVALVQLVHQLAVECLQSRVAWGVGIIGRDSGRDQGAGKARAVGSEATRSPAIGQAPSAGDAGAYTFADQAPEQCSDGHEMGAGRNRGVDPRRIGLN